MRPEIKEILDLFTDNIEDVKPHGIFRDILVYKGYTKIYLTNYYISFPDSNIPIIHLRLDEADYVKSELFTKITSREIKKLLELNKLKVKPSFWEKVKEFFSQTGD